MFRGYSIRQRNRGVVLCFLCRPLCIVALTVVHAEPPWHPHLSCSVRSDAILSALAGSLAAICAGQPTATGMAQTAVLQSGELQQWHVSWDDLHMERLLGRGSFGRVRRRREQLRWSARHQCCSVMVECAASMMIAQVQGGGWHPGLHVPPHLPSPSTLTSPPPRPAGVPCPLGRDPGCRQGAADARHG